MARNRPRCARTSPGFPASRTHFPWFPAASRPLARALPPVSRQRHGIRDGNPHKCAISWQEVGTCARHERTYPAFQPSYWQETAACARAVRTSPRFLPSPWRETAACARAVRTSTCFLPSPWQETATCARARPKRSLAHTTASSSCHICRKSDRGRCNPKLPPALRTRQIQWAKPRPAQAAWEAPWTASQWPRRSSRWTATR